MAKWDVVRCDRRGLSNAVNSAQFNRQSEFEGWCLLGEGIWSPVVKNAGLRV